MTFKLLFGRLYLATNSSSVFKSLSFHFLPVSSFDLHTTILELNECNVQMWRAPSANKIPGIMPNHSRKPKNNSCYCHHLHHYPRRLTACLCALLLGFWYQYFNLNLFLLAPWSGYVCVCSYVCVPVFIMCLCISWKFPKSFKEVVIK